MALVVIPLFTSSALAEAPSTMSPKEVKSLVQQAKTMVATQNVVQAIAIYEQLYAGTSDPKYLYNVGYLYEDTGQLDMAWDFYQRFLLAWPDAPNAAKLATYLGELKEKLEADYVLVHVFTTPPGASVTVTTSENERKPSSVTPMSTWMPFGKVTLKLELEGYEALEKKITVKPRKSQRLRLNLIAKASANTLKVGAMPPSARLSVDGTPRPEAQAGGALTLEPGERTLTLTFVDGTERTHTLKVSESAASPAPEAGWWLAPEGGDDTAEESSSETDAGLSTSISLSGSGGSDIPMATWISGGVAIGATVGAIALIASAHMTAQDAQVAMDTFNTRYQAGEVATADAAYWDWKAPDDSAVGQQTGGMILLGVAGAAALTSVLWWLLDTPAAPASDAALVSPVLLKGGLGAQATWSF